MNVFKIALRSVQFRGLGSFLTILSMALGVMMVVGVLTIHGVISDSFRNNSSFGYNLLVGPQGGSLQLTMNSVFYLSQPIDTLPYEYYLAFCGKERRQEQMRNSIAHKSLEEYESIARVSQEQFAVPGAGAFDLFLSELAQASLTDQLKNHMQINEPGLFDVYTDVAIPILLGDYFVDPHDNEWRVCGTNSDFFNKLVLDVDLENHFEFAAGRSFADQDPEAGLYGCVLGSLTARKSELKIGDRIQITHGIPESSGSHLHEQDFIVVGILAPTGTPNDRAVFVNMEGFYLMSDHSKPVRDDSVLASRPIAVDPFAEQNAADSSGEPAVDAPEKSTVETNQTVSADPALLSRTPLPIEHREITSILLKTSKNDPFQTLGVFLPPRIKEGGLAETLKWSPFRPERAQSSAQAVSPVEEVTKLFADLVDPVRWVLLILTVMICIVSGLSILVGIYNSMSQRQHEIAVMRALGASRGKVMLIMLLESILLALSGGLLGWVAGHGLNSSLGPLVEARTGVPLGFWQFAPKVPIFAQIFGNSNLPPTFLQFSISPEFLLIPGLILLAIVVGIYPAISAYRTDVARSLGK